MRTNYNSRYKIHNQELSAKDVIQKKKEKILNDVEKNDEKYNNDLKKKGNQVISVSNYGTYNSITKPKYNHTFSSEILSGHNVFKYINENGKLSDKNRTLTVKKQCLTSSLHEEVFLNDTYDEMTNYLDDDDAQLINDMIQNEMNENETIEKDKKVTFSLIFYNWSDPNLVDDSSRNAIIDSIYSTLLTNDNYNISISRSDIKILSVMAGSVIIDIEIITYKIAILAQIVSIIESPGGIYPDADVSNIRTYNGSSEINIPVAIPSSVSLNEDSSCNIYLSISYSGTSSIKYRIRDLPNDGNLFKTDDNGLYVLLSYQNIDTAIDSNVFHYVPSINYYGNDSFTYQAIVSDDNDIQSGEATVNMTIHGINDEPDNSLCQISGEFEQGATIQATVRVTDDDNLTTSRESIITYQWQVSDYSDNSFTNIFNAINASYDIPNTKEYVNKYIRLIYTATDNCGTDISYVSDVFLVENVNHPCIVKSIEILDHNGNNVLDSTIYKPVQGNIVEVSFNINDEDVSNNDLTKYSSTPSFTYQWYRVDTRYGDGMTMINNATDFSYLVTDEDVNKYIYIVISYNDNYTDESFNSSFTNIVESHGNNGIYFNPSSDSIVKNIYVDQSDIFFLDSAIDRFDDYSDINYRILAKSSINDNDWSNDNFNDLSGYDGWLFNDSQLQITVNTTYYTFLDQSNNWNNSHIELQLEAYSISTPDISAIYTLKFQVNDIDAPIWDWNGYSNGTLPNISQGTDFSFDLSLNISDVISHTELTTSLTINLTNLINSSWISLDPFTYPNVRVIGTPSNEHVGSVSFQLEAIYGTKTPVLTSFNFSVLNIDDTPSISTIQIARDYNVLSTSDDICQNNVLDMSFTINDTDVSTNSFNQHNISSFFESSDKYQYQWYRDSSSISGATDLSYTLVHADVSCYIWVDISYTDKYDFSFDISSSKYGPVYNVNDLPTSDISFTVNSSIHSENDHIYEYDVIIAFFTINDIDVSTNPFNQNNVDEFFNTDKYQYQWYRDSTAITNATGLSYTLVSDDISSNIWFKMSYTDRDDITEDISKIVSTQMVLNFDTSSDLVITLSYEHLMIGYEIRGTLDWRRVDEDYAETCEYQFQKGTSDSYSQLQNWQTISIADISTVTNYDVSMILPDDTVGYNIRLVVKEQDVYGNILFFNSAPSMVVSDWSYTGSTSEFFFSRNGRVVNSTVQNSNVESFILLTNEDIGDSSITTDSDGEIDLSFSRTPARYYNYDNFLIVTRFSEGNVRVIEETSTAVSGETIIQNNDFFYKVFRVYTLFNADGSIQTRDISDNSISSDYISFGVINSACNAVVFELTLQDFWNDFSANNPSLTISSHPNSDVLLTNIAENPDVASGDISFTDLKDYFGDVSYDYILESCADFVMSKVEEKQNLVINTLGISNEEIDKNPYDIVKMESFHTICTSIVNSVLSRNFDSDGNVISIENKEILCRNTYKKILHFLEPGNLDISFSISNKDSVTNYISEVISDINHYDDSLSDNNNEIVDFRSFMDDKLKPFLINIGRDMVDSTFDTYIDSAGYISSILKSRSLMSGVNLRSIDISNSITSMTNEITLLKVSQELSLVRGFKIPSDVYRTPVVFQNPKYYLEYDANKNIYMKVVSSNKYPNIYNFAVWYEASGILMDDIEDYPSLTHYTIVLETDISYTFITNNSDDNTFNNYIDFGITPTLVDASNMSYISNQYFYKNPTMFFARSSFLRNDYVTVTNYQHERQTSTRKFYII